MLYDQDRPDNEASNGRRIQRHISDATEKSFGTIRMSDIGLNRQLSSRSLSKSAHKKMGGLPFDRSSLKSPNVRRRSILDRNSLVSPGMSARPLVSPGMGGNRTLDWTSPALMSPAIVSRPPVRGLGRRQDSSRGAQEIGEKLGFRSGCSGSTGRTKGSEMEDKKN